MILITPKKASATISLNPDPGTSIPWANRDYLVRADSYPQTPAFTAWIALQSNAASTIVTVPYGTPSIDLAWYSSTAVGWGIANGHATNSGVTDSTQQVVNTSYTAGMSPIIGGTIWHNYGTNYNTIGTYRNGSIPFVFSPPDGFTATPRAVVTSSCGIDYCDYTVKLGFKGINAFDAGVFICVGGRELPTTSLLNYSPCDEYLSTITIRVHNYPNVTVSGRVFNINNPTQGYGGVRITTCGIPGTTTSTLTNANGDYSFSYPGFVNHCVRIDSSTYPAGTTGRPYLRPWGAQYGNGTGAYGSPGCIPGYGSPIVGYCTNPSPGPTTYEWQVAGAWCMDNTTYCGTGKIGGADQVVHYDRNSDTGYDFVFNGPAPTPISCSNTSATNEAELGRTTKFTADGVYSSYAWSIVSAGLGTSTGASQTFSVAIPLTYTGTTAEVRLVANGSTTYCTVDVITKPYLRIYGSDISAGVDFTNCKDSNGVYKWGSAYTDDGSGEARGWTYTSSDPPLGSGAQLGVFALGRITGFSSAMMRATTATSAPFAPAGLDFANASSPYGNSKESHCIHDYWGNILSANPTTVALLNYQSTGTYATTAATSLGINAAYSMSDSIRSTVYVDGNLGIRNNITYSGAGAWTSANQIPRVKFVVSGNIYIGSGVTQLDGIYIAQPRDDGTGGFIYTCSNVSVTGNVLNSADPYTNPNYANCKKQLTINGALVANTIKWGRIGGTLQNSTGATEYPGTTAAATCAGMAASQITPNVCASEVVNYSPELYMPGTTTFDFDSYRPMPPIL